MSLKLNRFLVLMGSLYLSQTDPIQASEMNEIETLLRPKPVQKSNSSLREKQINYGQEDFGGNTKATKESSEAAQNIRRKQFFESRIE